MKMPAGMKRRAKKQRQRKIKIVYNNFYPGSDVTFLYSSNEYEIHEELVLRSKHELNETCYFLCEGKTTKKIYVMKLVYIGRVKIILLSEKKYEENKETFQSWINEIKI